MARVFDGKLGVGYHTATLETATSDGNDERMPEDCFAGQTNGLCGAVVPGMLMLTTGLHHGKVGFTIDVQDDEPPFEEVWEEVVEVSFVQKDAEAILVGFYGSIAGTFTLAPGIYRVRYGARNMSQAWEVDTHTRDQPIDFYSLTFWPAAVTPDAILKQTGEFAKYSHQTWGNPPS